VILQPEGWESSQRILVILAHPDDPEFFCGATLARWINAGHEVHYCILTQGDKGTDDRLMTPQKLAEIRVVEQKCAALKLGIKSVCLLNNQDGYLTPDLNLRRDVTRIIRKIRPDVVLTCDPTNLFYQENRINHPDHRAAGQVVLDAVFPAANNFLFFEELLTQEHLEPVTIREVWISLPSQANVTLDVTDFWEQKIQALLEHKTQIGEPDQLIQRMRSRHTPDSTPELPRYEEKFRRIVFQ
jgi:LmbE family N-acetylglucosaminyl deacetylase